MPERRQPVTARRFRRVRTTTALLLTAGLMLGAAPPAATAAPAHAAVSVGVAQKVVKPSVSIGVIPTKTVTTGKKTTIKPVLVKKGATEVKSARVTVTAGKKIIAKNKTSATLGAGSYKIQTKVTYRVKSGKTWSGTKSVSRTQTLQIKSVKPSAKVNTTAGKKECLALINAKRKANKLKALTLVKAGVPSPVERMYSVGTTFSGFYYFEKTQWPTAKDWVGTWFADDPTVKRLIKDKSASRVTVTNSFVISPHTKKKFNAIDIEVYKGTKNAGAPQTPPQPTSDVGAPDARPRIITGIQQVRAGAKLPPLIVSTGAPSLKSDEYIPQSSGTGHPYGTTVKAFLAEPSLVMLAKSREFTHVSVSIVKKGSYYEVSADFYQVANH